MELFDVVAMLSTQPVPAGPRVGVVTNAGGPGILLADACEAQGLLLPQPADDHDRYDCARSCPRARRSEIRSTDRDGRSAGVRTRDRGGRRRSRRRFGGCDLYSGHRGTAQHRCRRNRARRVHGAGAQAGAYRIPGLEMAAGGNRCRARVASFRRMRFRKTPRWRWRRRIGIRDGASGRAARRSNLASSRWTPCAQWSIVRSRTPPAPSGLRQRRLRLSCAPPESNARSPNAPPSPPRRKSPIASATRWSPK